MKPKGLGRRLEDRERRKKELLKLLKSLVEKTQRLKVDFTEAYERRPLNAKELQKIRERYAPLAAAYETQRDKINTWLQEFPELADRIEDAISKAGNALAAVRAGLDYIDRLGEPPV